MNKLIGKLLITEDMKSLIGEDADPKTDVHLHVHQIVNVIQLALTVGQGHRVIRNFVFN